MLIEFRQDTYDNWMLSDVILSIGEPSVAYFEDDRSPILKIGDGVTKWSLLKEEGHDKSSKFIVDNVEVFPVTFFDLNENEEIIINEDGSGNYLMYLDSDNKVHIRNINAELEEHISTVTGNPHNVTKTEVGLSNVTNNEQLPLSYLDTDNTLVANSDVKVTSQKAVKGYVDNKIGDLTVLKTIDKTNLVNAINESLIEWTPTREYFSNDVVIYNGLIYKAIDNNQSLVNFILNGNFESANHWGALYASLSVNNNKAIISGNGTSVYSELAQTSNIECVIGKRVYVRGKLKPTNKLPSYIDLRIWGATTGGSKVVVTQSNLQINDTYDLSGIIEIDNSSTGLIKILARSYYSDSSTQNGSIIEVSEMISVDLGDDANSHYYNHTKQELDNLTDPWFDGIKIIPNVGNNPSEPNGYWEDYRKSVTSDDVGLGNVTNDAQIKKSSSSTSGNVPTWNGITGDALNDGYSIETTLTGSDAALARADAIKNYVDLLLGANDAMIYKGAINCSDNPNYPAGNAGWTWKISVAGKIGGASGPNVEVGDMIICCMDDTITGNHATVGANFNIIQVNIDGAVIGPVSSTDENFPLFDGVSGRLIKNSTFNSGSFTPSSHVGSTGAAHGAATISVDGFMSSTDKAKLDNVESNANNYAHPESHPASIITQDSNNRFVTDTEKEEIAKINGKSDKFLLDNIEIHPVTFFDIDEVGNPILEDDVDGNYLLTTTSSGSIFLKEIETPEGAQTKADDAESSAKSYIDKLTTLINEPSVSNGQLILDLNLGRYFKINLESNITSIIFNNVPQDSAATLSIVFTQDSTGGHDIPFPASIKWSGVPIMSTEPGYTDIITLITVDGGINWYGTASVGHN